MPNGTLPNWVDPKTSPMRNGFGVNVQQAAPNNVGMSGGFVQPQQQQVNPNAWDGIGRDTNQTTPDATGQQPQSGDAAGVSNFGNPMPASQANLPQNIQQILQMFATMNGQQPQFQPVNGNPFNAGSNLNTWGQNTNKGIYGGT